MLIGALMAIFFSSASDLPGHGFINMLNTFIEQGITEPDRRKAISRDVKNMEAVLADFSKKLKKGGKRMVKINKDHDSSRAVLENILDELNRERADTQQKILDLRFSIKNQMTREEWKVVFAQQ